MRANPGTLRLIAGITIAAAAMHLIANYYLYHPGSAFQKGAFGLLSTASAVTGGIIGVNLFHQTEYATKALAFAGLGILLLLSLKFGSWQKNTRTVLTTLAAALLAYAAAAAYLKAFEYPDILDAGVLPEKGYELAAIAAGYIFYLGIGNRVSLRNKLESVLAVTAIYGAYLLEPGSLPFLLLGLAAAFASEKLRERIEGIKTPGQWPKLAGKAFYFALIAISLAKLYNISSIDLQEEGIYAESHALYGAKLVSEGYRYLKDFEYLHTPLSLYLFAISYKLHATGMDQLRLWGVAASALIAFLTYRIAEKYTGKTTAAAAGILLLTNPLLFKYSRLAHPDLLLALFATLSIYLLEKHYSTGKKMFLAASAFSLALAYLTKETALVILAAVEVHSYLHHKSIRPGLKYALLMLAPIAAHYAWLYAGGTNGLGYWRVFFSTGAGSTLMERMQDVAGSFGRDLLLSATLLLAALHPKSRRQKLLLAWMLSLLALLWYSYYRPNYTLLFLPPAAILGAMGLQNAIEKAWTKDRVLGTIAIALVLALFIQNVAADVRILRQDGSGQANALEGIVKANTEEGASIIATKPILALTMNRTVPLELFEISANRISRGEINAETVIDSIERNNVRVVIVDHQKLNMSRLTNYMEGEGFRKETVRGRLRDIEAYTKR